MFETRIFKSELSGEKKKQHFKMKTQSQYA